MPERLDPGVDAGDALFIAGYETEPRDDHDALLQHITSLGEALLASGLPWRIRRLAAPGSDRDVPTRRNVRRELDALFARPATARLIVVVGQVTRTFEGLGLVCAPDLSGFREDATVPLEWMGEGLRRTTTPSVVMLAARSEQADPQRWLTALASQAAEHLVVTCAGDRIGSLSALLAGLRLDAADGASVVTPRSLTLHLSRALGAAALHASTSLAALTGDGGEHRGRPGARLLPSDGEADELIGARLPGRFRIEGELGRGSFAIVYRAHQELVGRDVAIKVLKHHVAPDAAEQFLAEARTVARLDHRNIVRIHHADTTADGRMFVAMELLAGRTLQQLLDDKGALPPPRAIAIAGQLLAALATAHAGGVIHADVTPSNIFVQDGAPERVVLLDFGLSRLRTATAVAALGGTPGFMAPEQLRSGRVDASSDLYAAGLVIAVMLTGQRPETPGALAAAVDAIEDAALRAVVRRALAEVPADRFASATDMALALPGDPGSLAYPARPPFRPAPFAESEHPDFFGREREIDVLLEHVLFRRAMIYVAPSGTGKTSLLRAGLSPRLERLGVRTVYVACRTGLPHGLAEVIDPEATEIVDAIARRHATGARRMVVLIDQVEAALHDATRDDTIVEQLGLARWPSDAQISVVLSVREEYLARLLDRTQRIEPGIPIVRLGPLTSQAAREVMVRTLAARELTIEPALIDELIADLELAAARLAGELGSGSAAAIYPPHLQLAGAMLYEARPAGATEIPLALYLQLGGLDKIIAEHLHHVLEGELFGDSTAIARDLLLALVTSSHTRTARAESELIAIALRAESAAPGAAISRTADAVRGVIGFLHDRGLIVALPGRPPDPELLWDLAHDSLVPRIEAWITSRDLARLRALELVRYHLRRSDARSLSLLGPDELREVAGNLRATDLVALDQDWARPDRGANPARRLVAASRRAIRRRRIAVAGTIAAAIAIATLLGVRWRDEREARLRETRLRDRDIGHFVLDLDAFDWDATTLTATAVRPGGALALDWELHQPVEDDEDSPGAAMAGDDLAREALPPNGALRSDLVAARGGPAVLVVHRRDPAEDAAFCHDVLVTMRRLPGYAAAGTPVAHLAVHVPSCAATRAGMIEIPAGPFIAGGQGDPPTPYRDDELPREAVVDLPRYWIDRTEATLGAMHQFTALRPLHGIAEPAHPADHTRYPIDPPYPVTAVTWREARAFCRFFGKDLPTLDQWDKALRGGTKLDGASNPCPRRNFAWCGDMHPGWANVRHTRPPAAPGEAPTDVGQPLPVGTTAHDASPYGVMDMVGNVQEWTRSPDLPYPELPADLPAAERHRRQTLPAAMMVTRGCNWGDIECQTVPLTIMPIPNERLREVRYFTFGMRCALEAGPS